jgi:CheY-like chemotaxis protein
MQLSIIPMIKKLVHIDDDPDDQELFAECIHSIDPSIHCTQLTDSKVALQNIKSSQLPEADMIFMDINMPRVNGMELLHALRQSVDYSTIPVAILTSSRSWLDVDKSKKLGATYFLTKPFTFREWEANLEQVVKLLWQKL